MTPREKAEALANDVVDKYLPSKIYDDDYSSAAWAEIVKILDPLLEEIEAARKMRDEMKSESVTWPVYERTREAYDAIRKRNERNK